MQIKSSIKSLCKKTPQNSGVAVSISFVCNSLQRTVCSCSAAQQIRNAISAGRFRPAVHSYGPSTAAYIKRQETWSTGTECYDSEDVKIELLAVKMEIDFPTYFDLYFTVKNICLKICLFRCAVFFWQCCRRDCTNHSLNHSFNLYLRELHPQVSLTAPRIFL